MGYNLRSWIIGGASFLTIGFVELVVLGETLLGIILVSVGAVLVGQYFRLKRRGNNS